MNQQAKADQQKINKLRKNLEQLKKMVTAAGFIELYFLELKRHQTQTAAFHKLNEQYHKLTGVYRYSSYNSFRILKNQYLKNK